MDQIPVNVYVHKTASSMGNVKIGEYSSLWPASSIRGDFSPITIGRGTSIQDCCVLHSTPMNGVTVGDFVTVGHGAVLHGCTIEDYCMIGMNATVLDGAVIGRGSIIAAGAVVREGTQVPAGSFAAGLPARVSPGKEGQEDRIKAGVLAYIALAQHYLDGNQAIDPQALMDKMGEMSKKIEGI
jgi:carbonic anhydrase/acetyltransferase-like protein (isoleucine patch superfamily)